MKLGRFLDRGKVIEGRIEGDEVVTPDGSRFCFKLPIAKGD